MEQDPQVLLELKAHREIQGLPAQREKMETMGLPALQVLLGLLAQPEGRVQQVRQDQQVALVEPLSSMTSLPLLLTATLVRAR